MIEPRCRFAFGQGRIDDRAQAGQRCQPVGVVHDADRGTVDDLSAVAAQMLVEPRGPGKFQPVADLEIGPLAFAAAAVNQSGVLAHLFGQRMHHQIAFAKTAGRQNDARHAPFNHDQTLSLRRLYRLLHYAPCHATPHATLHAIPRTARHFIPLPALYLVPRFPAFNVSLGRGLAACTARMWRHMRSARQKRRVKAAIARTWTPCVLICSPM